MAGRHGRAQSLLLLGKLLDARDNASPFTLVQDTLEQTAKPLLKEYLRRAQSTSIRVIFVSFETHRIWDDLPRSCHITAGDDLEKLRENVLSALPAANENIRSIIMIDNLNILSGFPRINLSAYLSGFINPMTSVVAVYHLDQPLSSSEHQSPYTPTALTIMRYLATAVLSIHSFSHVLSNKMARDRSVAAPLHGLQETEEGAISGLGSQDSRGIIIELEHRRRSGRSVHALFFMKRLPSPSGTSPASVPKHSLVPTLMLLHDHPAFRPVEHSVENDHTTMGEISFNLALTEKQRQDRDGVALPYFDAQNEDGAPGEGGRILYDMGAEDDFDEEEDEI